LAWLALCCLVPGAATEAAEWRLGPLGFGAGSHIGTQQDSSGHLALSSFAGANLALGAGAVAGENALTGSRSLTDGDRSTEWRFNNKAEVLGEWVRVDLGGDRGVTRVRILPGKTFDVRPLFYLKGRRPGGDSERQNPDSLSGPLDRHQGAC
jgi:hypothetical protein